MTLLEALNKGQYLTFLKILVSGGLFTTTASGESAGLVVVPELFSGETNPTSPTNSYLATKHNCNASVLKATTSAQAVSAGAPAYLMGITVHTALTDTLTITGLNDIDGTPVNWVIPAASVGNVLPPGNARRCETALIATLSNATDGVKTIIDWRPI